MALFTGIGDFFRGVFGESEDEKRKRKQREAQQAAARQQQPKPQPVKQPTQVTDLFGTKNNPLQEGLTQKPQLQQQTTQAAPRAAQPMQPKPQPQPTQQPQQAPKPTPQPSPMQVKMQQYQNPGVNDIGGYYASDLKRLNEEVSKGDKADPNRVKGLMQSLDNRKKELQDYHSNPTQMSQMVKDPTADFVGFVKRRRAAAEQAKKDQEEKLVLFEQDGKPSNRTTTVNEYTKYFNSLDDTSKVNLLRGLSSAEDPTSRYLLESLNRNGSLDGSLKDFYQGFIDKSGGGLARAGLRLGQTGLEVLDKILPGQDQAPQMKWGKIADNLDENYRNTLGAQTKSGKGGETLGTATKAGIDVATLVAGGAGADGLVEAPQALQKGGFFARLLGRGLEAAPSSLANTSIAAAQTRGRGDKQNLARDAGLALVIDTLTRGLGGSKLLRGGEESVDDVARTSIQSEINNAQDLEANIAKRSQAVRDAAANPQEAEGVIKSAKQQELEAVINDEAQPAFRRQQAQQELDDLLAQEAKAAETGLDRPTFQHQQDIQAVVDRETENFNRYINEHPELTQQQIEAARDAAKERVVKLTDELKVNRYGTEAAVAQQADNVDNAIEAQQVVNKEVQAAQAAETAPAPGQIVSDQPVPTSPEVAANNEAYRQSNEQILFGNNTDSIVTPKQDLNLLQTVSPDRIIRENITRPIENAANRAISTLQTSDNAAARGVGRFFTGFSTEAGVSPELQTARMLLRGGTEYGKLERQAISDLAEGMNTESLARVWATLDPEQASKLGITVEQLTPEETVLRDKLKTITDNVTAENLRRGLITPEQAANESYLKRAYTIYDGNEAAAKFEGGFRRDLVSQYKGRKEVSEAMVEKAITDPAYLVGKKTAESNAMWAMQDYGNFLTKSGMVEDVARPGFTQLPDSPIFGEAAGKFVPRNIAEEFTGFQYNNAFMSAMNDVFTAYDRLGIRQAKKELLTVFNPAVRLGNQVTNRAIFSNLAGINPVQFNTVYMSLGKDIAENSPLVREAVQQGLTGIDVTQAEFFAQRLAASEGEEVSKGLAKQATDWVKNSYSGADDKARIAAYIVQRGRGYSPEEAARLVQRGFQDYKSVGYFYDIAAKTPLIGNAFVRFAADSIRIAKNAAVDHPLRTAATVALWANFVNIMSKASGETADEKKAREDRFGNPKLPFTDISLAVQTPFGEINVARFMPWYAMNDIQNGGVQRLLPFTGNPLNSENWNDPVLGQVGQLIKDKDFRGKSISDPNNNMQGDKFATDPLSTKDKMMNRLRFLFNNNAPVGREIDQLVSAAQGKEDIYGQSRSLPQAAARALGFKVQEFGDKQQEDLKSRQAYQDELNTINEQLKNMNPGEQEAWKRLTGYYKIREQVPNEFAPGETRDKKAEVYNFSEDKWKDFAANPKLYALMVQKKQMDAQRQGTPIQPEFDPRLSEEFRKQLIANKSVAPGDDAELDQRMYSQPEWDYYQQLKDEYKKKASEYYPKTDKANFDDETVKHDDGQFPAKPNILKQYSAQYAQYLQGKSAKPEFTDALKAAKESYNKQTLDWTNQARKARGLPAITWDVWNNPTFGFDETPSGFGFGFGGGGSRGTNTLSRLTDFSSDVKRLEKVDAQAMPNLVQLFAKLRAGSGGGRSKPKLGASSSGR